MEGGKLQAEPGRLRVKVGKLLGGRRFGMGEGSEAAGIGARS